MGLSLPRPPFGAKSQRPGQGGSGWHFAIEFKDCSALFHGNAIVEGQRVKLPCFPYRPIVFTDHELGHRVQLIPQPFDCAI